MPGRVKVKIIAGRNLPVMDRSSDTTDAYVEIKLGGITYKTDVCRKSLHPQWNSEWYRFEVDDSELQDEPLQMRLMDHDTYSANDAIGKVYLDLNPLLLPAAVPTMKYGDSSNHDNTKNSLLSGWIPVFDTMHGIRGEVNVIVKVELFSDSNRYRESSCGVQFFFSPIIPQGYYAQALYGFVEELVVCDDPEYQWIDKIRTPRASNEARQTLFLKLSGEIQRRIGVKALEFGANSVIGYRHSFDLEGESGIVARGIGTAAFLVKRTHVSDSIPGNQELTSSPQPDSHHADHHRSESVGAKISQSPAKLTQVANINRRSSDSDLSIIPKGNSLTGNERSGYIGQTAKVSVPSRTHQGNLDMAEYPFLTLHKYPAGFILHLGGAVSARSVKLLQRISNIEEPETRDTWWSDLRMEIRSHAKALNCNAILGYTETSSICEDVCVLSGSGTAVIIGIPSSNEILDHPSVNGDGSIHNRNENDKENIHMDINAKKLVDSVQQNTLRVPNIPPCTVCHIPYTHMRVGSNTLKCVSCRNGKVPEVLIITIELPDGMPTVGQGCFLQVSISRPLKDVKGESNAKEISDGLPFLEYELHRILVNKMKIKGMNAIFHLQVRISIGERLLIGTATGTGVFLSPLHSPIVPKLVSNRKVDQKKIVDLQRRVDDTISRNRKIYQLKSVEEIQPSARMMTNDAAEEEKKCLALKNEDCCFLEVDDPDDAEIVNLLMEECPPHHIHVVNSEVVPGLEELEIVKNLQMFQQIYRSKITYPFSLNQHFQKLLKCVHFKLRRMVPCAVCDLKFRVDVPDTDEIQICVLGMALGLGYSQKFKLKKKNPVRQDDLIFNLEDVNIPENSAVDSTVSQSNSITPAANSNLKISSSINKQKSIIPAHRDKQRHIPHKERYGVDITPLSYIPGGKIEKYLGNLNFFLIRETTSIREEGGLSGFLHSFITEVLAIVRAHVASLGGNGMVSYFLSEYVLNYNLHKNQGQCLINVGGDVVYVSYYKEERTPPMTSPLY